MWTFQKYFHKHLDAQRLFFGPFLWMRSLLYACVGTRGKVKERKAGGWNHRKGQSEVKERRKPSSARDREAARLKCWYKKRERGRLTKEDTGYVPFIWELQRTPCCFSLYCVLLASLMNSRGLVWSISVIPLLFHKTFLLVLSKAMAPHSSTLAWKIPWMEEPGGLQSMGSLRVRYDRATSLSLFTFMQWRRKWQPTPVFLPGESQGWESLVGCRLWGRTDTTEAT